MAEERLDVFLFPELKEVENKLGRKTPESLLIWMRDAAHCGGGCSSVVDRGDRSAALSASFSDRISSLKQEMRRLRSADVSILRQLLAVHEGVEAMRWLTEERGALVSRGSSSTGSLSSLVTVEERGPPATPCRESPSPTCPQDVTGTTGEEAAGHRSPHTDNDDDDAVNTESTEVGPPGPSQSKFEVASSNAADGLTGAVLQKCQPQDLDAGPLQDIEAGAGTITRALLRSRKKRREVKGDTSSFTLTQASGETQAERSRPVESLKASQNNVKEEEEEGALNRETVLLGYDAQWCWVESEDDVTFL
ncbi:hypothetical protein F2P81_000904 [Scophthalmus maximus]|uniref:Leucine rich adaptor protein 1-like n=1 Tax=Scophthalmus maximus TaxID=52904 RepID=A0A6A4TXQ6_SCOMX|nr:hypothetical protein F2P81_000904 [Scophthalmus maximus]